MGAFLGIFLAIIIIVIIVMVAVTVKQLGRQSKYKPVLDEYIKNNINVTNVIKLKTVSRDYSLYVDEPGEQLLFVDMQRCQNRLFKFSEIIGFELREDGRSTNGVGRAVAGGLMFGGTGAIVGAVTQKEMIDSVCIVLYLDDLANPEWIIKLNDCKLNKNSSEYRQISAFSNQFGAIIKLIISRREKA